MSYRASSLPSECSVGSVAGLAAAASLREAARYTYSITGTAVVGPDDAQALVTGTTKPTVTLITCTPTGTALQRLLVTATQVSPDPGAAAEPTETSQNTNTKPAAMPGNGSSILEQLFGAGR